jgi:methylmalonyl-CoA/ethylmalonyl-CoA epimerase
MFSDLKQHHIGCLVASIDDFKNENKEVWDEDKYSQVFLISSQDVKVCFLQMSTDTCLELVEPGSQNQPLAKLLNKGITYYHIGFISNTYDESVDMLINSGCRQLSEFKSEAFNGKRCAFFYHQSIRLIELIED